MIKFLLILMLFIIASAFLGGGLGILLNSIGMGAGALFYPLGMIIEFLNEIFIGMFTNYYILIIFGIFLFIILFFMTLKFFIGGIQDKVNEFDGLLKSRRKEKRINRYNKFLNKQENLKKLDKKYGQVRVDSKIKQVKIMKRKKG